MRERIAHGFRSVKLAPIPRAPPPPTTPQRPPGLSDVHRPLALRQFTLRTCNTSCYTLSAIRTFRHSGVEKFFKTGSKAGIQPKHAARLRILLTTLNLASTPLDMKRDGWDWHTLKGDLKGHWSVKVNGNWRLTFTFEGEDAILVDYQDYH